MEWDKIETYLTLNPLKRPNGTRIRNTGVEVDKRFKIYPYYRHYILHFHNIDNNLRFLLFFDNKGNIKKRNGKPIVFNGNIAEWEEKNKHLFLNRV